MSRCSSAEITLWTHRDGPFLHFEIWSTTLRRIYQRSTPLVRCLSSIPTIFHEPISCPQFGGVRIDESRDVARQQSRAKEEPRSPEEKKEPDWLWLSSLLQPSSSRPGGGEPLPRADSEDLEYFPGGDLVAERTQTDVFALIAETSERTAYGGRSADGVVPPDLVLSLVNTYVSLQVEGESKRVCAYLQFDVVQPKWPIIHVPTFFTVCRSISRG